MEAKNLVCEQMDWEQVLLQNTTLYQEHKKHKGLFKLVIFP